MSSAAAAGSNTLRDEVDRAPLLVREGEQLIFDVGDPDVARAQTFDRVRAHRPHLAVRVRGEQTLLDLGWEAPVLTALDGDDLLPAHIALVRGLPHDLVSDPLSSDRRKP